MKKINQDIDNILSLEEKKKILKQIDQEKLIELFKGKYKEKLEEPIVNRKTEPLDQQLTISLTPAERKALEAEIKTIKKLTKTQYSLSGYIRKQALTDIDIIEWSDRALLGLEELKSDKYNKKKLESNLRFYEKELQKAQGNPSKQEFLRAKLRETNAYLEEVNRKLPKKSCRLTGRVTYNEAVDIKWRASRLSLTVADYLRFVLFGYLPFSENGDKHLSIDSRRRFYISILDVKENGWGEPRRISVCPNCQKLIKENRELRQKIDRIQTFSDQKE